jgi:hypothetical protein
MILSRGFPGGDIAMTKKHKWLKILNLKNQAETLISPKRKNFHLAKDNIDMTSHCSPTGLS